MELEKFKILLGIPLEDTEQDTVLQFILDDVCETILNYCHIAKLPKGLEHTGYRMAMDLYRYDRPGDGSTPIMVSSISEGDTSTSFTSAADALAGGILKDYRTQLNRYRKVAW